MRNLDRGYSRKDLGVSYVKVCSFDQQLSSACSHFSCFINYFPYLFALLLSGRTYFCCIISYPQEKRLRMNMGLKKLRERVKKQQEVVGKKVTMMLLNYPIRYYPLFCICISSCLFKSLWARWQFDYQEYTFSNSILCRSHCQFLKW